MKHGPGYWSRHVAAWRRSGQSKKAYSEQHGVSYWSLRYWAAKLAQPDTTENPHLVELKAPVASVAARAAIELVVADRYVLRLWPNAQAQQLREVLAVLEGGR